MLGELGDKMLEENTVLGRLALKALRELRSRWAFQPVELRADQGELAVVVATRIRERGLVPVSERNDSLIVTESAILECTLLVSEDSHLNEIDRATLKSVLAEFGLTAPVIATPRAIVKNFYR